MGRIQYNYIKFSPWHAEHFCHYILSAMYYGFWDISKLQIRGNNSYKESSYNFGTATLNVALDMLNIFAITFYQPYITV